MSARELKKSEVMPPKPRGGKHSLEATAVLGDPFLPLPELSNHKDLTAKIDDAFDGTALFVVLAMYRSFSVLDRDQVEKLGKLEITPLHFNILATLQRANSPTTVGALSSMLVVRANNMSGNINTLIRMEFIERQVNPQDSRSFLINLTEKGHKFLNQTLPEHWNWLERLMRELSTKERTQLVKLLQKMVRSIETAHNTPEPDSES